MKIKKKNKKNTIPNSMLPKGSSKQSIIIVGLLIVLAVILYYKNSSFTKDLPKAEFQKMLRNREIKQATLILNKGIVEITIKSQYLDTEYHKSHLGERGSKIISSGGPHYSLKIPSIIIFDQNFKDMQRHLPPEQRITYETKEKFDLLSLIANWSGLVVSILLFWLFFKRMPGGGGGGGGGIFGIGKSKASLFNSDDKNKITFADVAALQEAKGELKEIVEFLKFPDKFTKLGGKLPKGALLIGPPGTGKTLLAKAVAGEAGVPFFSISGSDFVEMFVGIGAARVRDLFSKAKTKAPCIIFIDEIDAVGKSRANALQGSNDERESTLNSLLVEMDGFGTDSRIIILAATNRPEILDDALLRPGRFDRQISIDNPDLKGREEIFKLHMKNLATSKKVKAAKLAEQTPGFTGAEISNVCNEAALIGARKNKKNVEIIDFQDAIDRVIGGLEKKGTIVSPHEKKIVAYHEAGHAVAGWFLEHADPLVKVSIVPRGIASLGYAQYLPKELHIYQYEQMIDYICKSLGGRVAEDIVFNKISTGALSDLEGVTKMAYGMVTVYGMNDKVGTVSFYNPKKDSSYSFVKPYSESTGMLIDEEVRQLVATCYERTKSLLLSKQTELEIIAKELIAKEVIFQKDVEKLIGPRPFNTDKNVDKKEITKNDNDILL